MARVTSFGFTRKRLRPGTGRLSFLRARLKRWLANVRLISNENSQTFTDGAGQWLINLSSLLLLLLLHPPPLFVFSFTIFFLSLTSSIEFFDYWIFLPLFFETLYSVFHHDDLVFSWSFFFFLLPFLGFSFSFINKLGGEERRDMEVSYSVLFFLSNIILYEVTR